MWKEGVVAEALIHPNEELLDNAPSSSSKLHSDPDSDSDSESDSESDPDARRGVSVNVPFFLCTAGVVGGGLRVFSAELWLRLLGLGLLLSQPKLRTELGALVLSSSTSKWNDAAERESESVSSAEDEGGVTRVALSSASHSSADTTSFLEVVKGEEETDGAVMIGGAGRGFERGRNGRGDADADEASGVLLEEEVGEGMRSVGTGAGAGACALTCATHARRPWLSLPVYRGWWGSGMGGEAIVWLDGTLGVADALSSSHRSKPRCCWRRLEEEDAEGKAATGDSGRRAMSLASSSGEA